MLYVQNLVEVLENQQDRIWLLIDMRSLMRLWDFMFGAADCSVAGPRVPLITHGTKHTWDEGQ